MPMAISPQAHEQAVMMLSRMVAKYSIDEMAAALLAEDNEAACPVIHRFSPGMYFREIAVKSGTFLIGHRQKLPHINIFLKGRVVMFNDDGGAEDLKAPMLFVGQPGRKCGYVVEDMVWLNAYPTEETDIETLEGMFIDKGDVWRETLLRRKAMRPDRSEDRADFADACAELGVTAAEVRRQSEIPADIIPMPHGSYKFMVADSDIEGRGIFATADIAAGEIIGPARLEGGMTPLGRYGNHAKDPNAAFEATPAGDILVRAARPIFGGHGGMPGEEITMNYRHNRLLAERMGQ